MTEQVDLSAKPYCDPEKRHDFVLVFDVTDGNPNGDPDAGNLPRTDPETLQGLVTDVSLKRKVRNFVDLVGEDSPDPARLKIYVEHRGVLNEQHKKAYRALDIPFSEAGKEELKDSDGEVLNFFTENQFEGFGLLMVPGDEEKYELVYSGELTKQDLNEVLDEIGRLSSKAKAFAKKISGKAKVRAAERDQVDKAREWMCANFYDVRMFGAVMSTKINAGQVRGPMQLTFSRSVDPVVPQDLAVTRMAVTDEKDREKLQTIGRKTLIPYGLYVGHGFFSPHLAKQTGVTAEDLSLFWDALVHMWAFDRSASRGMMAPRGLYIFTHDTKLGNAPAHKLFELIKPKRNDGVKSPRKFEDYTVNVGSEVPGGVTLNTVLE